ncbi:DUF1385 domain-containing protein [Bacillus sp. FSL K6-6540]|uniref:DUF1385 domain-containing protein n=1 Tax=Bacillus sp. FSL K6-6540 TaxID=2921512 RepID=UPI0030FC1445
MIVDVNGGRAHINGITYYSGNYISQATRKNNEIVLHLKQRKIIKDRFYTKIPFLRGIFAFGEILFQSRTTVIVWMVLLAMMYVNRHLDTPFFSKPMSKTSVVLAMGILVLSAIALIRFTPIGRYHAAEHMAEKVYSKGEALTVENVMKESRVHEYCGTNLAVFVVVLFFFIFSIGTPWWISALISWVLSYEIFLTKSKSLRKWMTPMYWLGGMAQKYLFTVPPSAKEIEVAIRSLEQLDKHDVHKEG